MEFITGYNLFWVSKDEWALEAVGYRSFHGTFAEITKFAVARFGFEVDDIAVAVQEMIDKDHNGANFGTFRRHIYTFKKDLTNVRKAG